MLQKEEKFIPFQNRKISSLFSLRKILRITYYVSFFFHFRKNSWNPTALREAYLAGPTESLRVKLSDIELLAVVLGRSDQISHIIRLLEKTFNFFLKAT